MWVMERYRYRGAHCASSATSYSFEEIEETYQSPLLEIKPNGLDGRFVISKVLKTSRRGEWRDQRSTGGGPGGSRMNFLLLSSPAYILHEHTNYCWPLRLAYFTLDLFWIFPLYF